MGWNRNPRAHIKGTASWETSSREGTVAVELPCKAASRTIQRLPSKCPGNTQDQSPHESMHKITKLLQPLKPGLANGKGQISEPQSIPQHLFTDILRSWVGGLIWGCMMQWHRKWWASINVHWERIRCIVYLEQFRPLWGIHCGPQERRSS